MGNGGGEPEPGLDLRQYIRVIWSHKWLVIFCVLVSIGLAAFQINRSAPVFSATAQVKFEPQGRQVVDFGERSSLLYQRDEILTAVELIKSTAVAERVLDARGKKPPAAVQDKSPISQSRRSIKQALRYLRTYLVSYETEELDPEVVSRQNAITNLLEGLRVMQVGDTKLINITYSGPDQQESAEIAREFAIQFINYMNDDQTQAVGYAREFLNQQVEKAKEELRVAEKALYDYSGQTNLKVMDQNLAIGEDTMVSLSREIEELKTELDLLEAEKRAVDEDLTEPTAFDDDPMISSLVRRLTDLKIEKLALSAENKADFPQIQRMDREISGIEDELAKLTAQMKDDSAARVAMTKYRLETLQSRLVEQQASVDKIREKMIEYRAFQREVDSAQEIYSSLLDQYKKIEVKDDINPSNVTISGDVLIPTYATSPNVTQIMMLFITMGGVIGMALALLLNWADRSVKDPAAVEERLGLPPLAFVPYIRRKRGLLRGKDQVPALVTDQAKGSASEAFHYLRTSLQFSSARKPPQVILLTSCLPREGKSTVSSNLARFSAQTGRRTLLIDADLKRPSVHRAFELSRMPGLSDVLTGQTELDDAVVSSSEEGLDILPAGNATPSPINLLESEAMTDLLNQLRLRYTTIILDSAPAHGMADSLVLCAQSDGVCLVVKSGKTHNDVLDKTVAKIRDIGGNLLGIVYNTGRERTMDYSYGYGSAYGYSYDAKPEKRAAAAK